MHDRPGTAVPGLFHDLPLTALSAPFQSRVPEEQLFAPERSAACLLEVIEGLGPQDTGGHFAWDGKPVPW